MQKTETAETTNKPPPHLDIFPVTEMYRSTLSTRVQEKQSWPQYLFIPCYLHSEKTPEEKKVHIVFRLLCVAIWSHKCFLEKQLTINLCSTWLPSHYLFPLQYILCLIISPLFAAKGNYDYGADA